MSTSLTIYLNDGTSNAVYGTGISGYTYIISTMYAFSRRNYVLKGIFPKTGTSYGGRFTDGDLNITSEESPYTNSSHQWIYAGSTATMYCEWESGTTYSISAYDGSTYKSTLYATYKSYGLAGWTAPTKTGFEFGGYKTSGGTLIVNTDGSFTRDNGYTNSNGKWTSTSYPSVLYEVWTGGYTITYNNGDGSGSVPTDSNTYAYGSQFTAKKFIGTAPTGKKFRAWKNKSSGEEYLENEVSTYTQNYDITLTAQYESETYVISYTDTYATSGTAPSSATVSYGNSYTLAGGGTLVRTGYTLSGWRLDSISGTVYGLTGTLTNVTANHTMYPYWIATVQIRYDKNGADDGSTPADETGPSGSSFTIAGNTGNLVREGYTFGGWNSQSDGSGTDYIPGQSYTFTSSKTIYVKWVVKTAISISFNSNGGTSGTAPSSLTGYAGDSFTIPSCDLKKNGYDIVGWSESSSSYTAQYIQTRSYTFNESKTLYAVYPREYSLTVQDVTGCIMMVAPTSHLLMDATVQCSCSPAPNYEFVEWTQPVGDGIFADETSETTTYTVKGDATISCTVRYVGTYYNITTSVYSGGKLETSQSSVQPGSSCTITATPSTINSTLDYTELISGTGTFSGNTFTPTSNCVIRSVFKPTTKEVPTQTDVQSRKYKILIHNNSKSTLVLLCMSAIDGRWYDDLKFNKKINEVGSGSFKLYTKTSSDCVGDGDKIEVGCRVIILQNNYPVYYGYITEYNKDDINYYGDHSYSGMNEYSISFSDVLRELNYSNQQSNSVVTGSVKSALYNILSGNHLGHISSSQSDTSVSISSQNTLSQLDKLGDTIGWRYRSRPEVTNIIQYANISSCPVSGTTGTISISGTLYNTKGIVIVSNGDSCHAYLTVTSEGSSFAVTSGVHTDNKSLGSTAKLYFIHDYCIDFAPSFLQSSSIVVEDSTIPSTVGTKRAWGTNNKAKNVKSAEGVDVKYGTVSVTSSQGSGLSYTSTIPLIREHNNDYSINRSTFVKDSLDYYCDDYTWEEEQGSVGYGLIYFDVKGTVSTLAPYGGYIILGFKDKEHNAIVYALQTNLGVGTIYISSVSTISGIPITHLHVRIDTNSYLYNKLTAGDIVPYCIMSNAYVLQDTSLNGITKFYLGGEHWGSDTSTSGSITGNILLINRGIGEGSAEFLSERPLHSIGTLVQDYSSVDSDSPYSKYPTRTLYAQPQSNMTYMDVDLIASSFAVFGSNFDAQGSASVPLPFFVKDDSSVDMIYGLPEVGDHIAFYDSSKSTSDAISDYELLSYDIDVKQLTNTIKYGTYSSSIGSALYNLRKNITTNIVRG